MAKKNASEPNFVDSDYGPKKKIKVQGNDPRIQKALGGLGNGGGNQPVTRAGPPPENFAGTSWFDENGKRQSNWTDVGGMGGLGGIPGRDAKGRPQEFTSPGFESPGPGGPVAGIDYDKGTDYQALINQTSSKDVARLQELYKKRAAKIYGEGMEEYYGSIPENLRYLQNGGQPSESGNVGTGGNGTSTKTQYTDQITTLLADLTDALKTPLTYDSSKDEGYQAAQQTIGKDVYKAMARRGISDSTMTPQQQYELSMQALPQFQANWENKQQQDKLNQMNLLSQLQGLDLSEFDKRQAIENLFLQKGQLTGDYLTPDQAAQLQNIDPSLLNYSDNYQAEINKRAAVNPNDPAILQLEYLRNQKIQGQGLTFPKSILGAETQQALQNRQANQFQQAQLTGQYLSPDQQRAVQNGISADDRDRITNIANSMNGGFQAYMNTLDPNSTEYVKAQMLRNQKISSQGLPYETSLGSQTLAGKQYELQKQEHEMNQKLRTEELEAARTQNLYLADQLKANLSSTQLANVGADIANQISQINLDYLPQEKKYAIKQIQQALRMGNLQEAQQRIINANLPDKLEADLNATIANIGATYAQTGNINVDTALKAYGGAGGGASGLISIASQWVGTPYLWGGDSKNGIDCSAFTRKVFNEYGVKLTGNTQSQVKQGKAVKKGELQPGDLIFFNTNRTNGHVGIYIGGNQFMHASSSKGVTTSSLDNSYYKARYSTARRVLK